VADLVLLMINGRIGFEMETFEFLNVLQVHGFPKVMGILTHLDEIPKAKPLKKIKKTLKARFWVEVYQGAKMFYFSGSPVDGWMWWFALHGDVPVLVIRPHQWVLPAHGTAQPQFVHFPYEIPADGVAFNPPIPPGGPVGRCDKPGVDRRQSGCGSLSGAVRLR
jgi:hypothetical protein